MAKGFSIKISGTQAAKLKMAGYAQKAINAMYEVGVDEAEAVAARARQKVKVVTGRLKGSIGVYSGAGKKGFKILVGPNPGKSRDDMSGAWYAPFIERGTSRMPAQPFMRPAFRPRKRFIRKGLREALNDALED